jgi:hypothetical protein
LRRFVMIRTLVAALVLAPALAAAQECPLPYSAFEFAVPHVDLESCPAVAEAPPGAFCRASMANDALHVFVFDGDGEQCLVRLVSVDEDAFEVVVE